MSLERSLKKGGRSQHERWALFLPPIKQGKLERLRIYVLRKETAQKEGAVRTRAVWYAISGGCSRFFLLEGDSWLSRTHIPNKPGCCQRTQCSGEAMQGSTYKTAHSLLWNAFETTTTSKIWPPCTCEWFLLYIRDIVKITKFTHIN